jgi:phosphohistidine swiveling domain-containing protein
MLPKLSPAAAVVGVENALTADGAVVSVVI